MSPAPPTSVPLRLAPDAQVGGRPDALLIPHAQVPTFVQLLYALPPAALERYRAVVLEQGFLVVGDGPVEEVPLGKPLRRYGPETFVPVGYTFLPRLSAALIAEALGATPGTFYFFLDPEGPPLAVTDTFEPLSRAFLSRVRSQPAQVRALPAAPGTTRLLYREVGPFPLWGRRFPDADDPSRALPPPEEDG